MNGNGRLMTIEQLETRQDEVLARLDDLQGQIDQLIRQLHRAAGPGRSRQGQAEGEPALPVSPVQVSGLADGSQQPQCQQDTEGEAAQPQDGDAV